MASILRISGQWSNPIIPAADKFISTLDRSPNTIKTYRWALSYYFDIAGASLSDDAYEKFLTSIRELKPSSKRVLRSAVMGLYAFCDVGDLSRRAKLNKHYMRQIKTKPVNVKRDEVEKIISHCDTLRGDLMELRDRAFVLTLADSGFRISELCELTRGDIDWREERVTITGKGDKTAVVRLSRRSIDALNDYLKARGEMDGASGKPLDTLPLFAQHGRINKTKSMTPDGMRKAVKVRMSEAGARVRVHDFRHYFVTVTMLASGGNLKLAQKLARHESVATTQRYAHLTETELDEQYDEMFNKR